MKRIDIPPWHCSTIVPTGYSHIKTGKVKRGDFYMNLNTGEWEKMGKEDFGEDISIWAAVIRKNKRKKNAKV